MRPRTYYTSEESSSKTFEKTALVDERASRSMGSISLSKLSQNTLYTNLTKIKQPTFSMSPAPKFLSALLLKSGSSGEKRIVPSCMTASGTAMTT